MDKEYADFKKFDCLGIITLYLMVFLPILASFYMFSFSCKIFCLSEWIV